MGVERTSNKSQHTNLTLETKLSRRSCQVSNSQPFDHKSGALTNKLSRLPSQLYNKLLEVNGISVRKEMCTVAPLRTNPFDLIPSFMSCLRGSFTFTYPLTARVVGAPKMTSQTVSSIFLCFPLPSETWHTPGLSIP